MEEAADCVGAVPCCLCQAASFCRRNVDRFLAPKVALSSVSTAAQEVPIWALCRACSAASKSVFRYVSFYGLTDQSDQSAMAGPLPELA